MDVEIIGAPLRMDSLEVTDSTCRRPKCTSVLAHPLHRHQLSPVPVARHDRVAPDGSAASEGAMSS